MPVGQQGPQALPGEGPTDPTATPGMKVLVSLQKTAAGRLERYKATTAGQQSKAKQSIPPPKHPGGNDLAAAPVEEVHQLPADVPRVQGNMQGILDMLQSKADRHAAAWEQYKLTRKNADDDHNTAAAAAAAASTRAKLHIISQHIEDGMAVLAEDRVMVLDEQQLQEVWTSVEQQGGTISACIDALATGLQSAEQAFCQQVQAALAAAVSALCDIAHLDEGRIQRLTEQEAATLNLQVLENRRVAAEVLEQLHASEILQEQARYKRWQAACEAWRTLRSRHAVACFCTHVSQELAEPAERLQLFEQLRQGQQEAHTQLLKLCGRLHQLSSPHPNSQLVASWVADATQWLEGWQQQLGRFQQGLQQQEEQLEDKVQQELVALRSEVLGYKGLSESQVDELLSQEVQPVLESRRAAAHTLLQCADTFLQRQAAEWQLGVQVLGSWLSSLVGLYESHKTNTAAAESAVKAAVRAAVQQFVTQDGDLEAALAAAVQLLSQGCDEKELDARLDAALQALAAVKDHYRARTTAAVSTVRAYPGQVKDRNQLYIKCLSGLLHVQRAQQQPAGSPAGVNIDAAVSAAGSVAGRTVNIAAVATEQSYAQAAGQVQLPSGAAFDQLHELWQALMDATPKPWLAGFSHIEHNSSSSISREPSKQLEAAAAAPPAPAAPMAQASAAGGKAAPAAKLTKQQLAEAAAAEEAARAAEAAAAAAAAEAAAYAAAAAQPPCPLRASTGALCQDLRMPDDTVSGGLQELQASLLLEADSFAARVQGGAESWAEEMEALLTEELDGRLRAHRPRAGRIEEEVRVVRSAELVAQRRRVDSHLESQEKAVQQQQTRFDAAVLALRADAAAWRAKLLDYERLLGNALSIKGIDICWREAQALRVKLDKQLEQRLQELQAMVQETCSSLDATSTAFEAEHLKSFAEGGRYAESSLAAHKAHLGSLHTYVAQQQAEQQSQLSGLRSELHTSLKDAQDTIEALLPSHKQDMALVELLTQKVEGARRKAAAELSKNALAADSIDAVLGELQSCLARVSTSKQHSSTGAGADGAKQECQQLVACVNKVRQQLLTQSQVLELLQSTSVPSQGPPLAIPSDLQPLPATQEESKVPTSGHRSTLPSARASTPSKGSQPGSKTSSKGTAGRAPSAATGSKGAQAGAAAGSTPATGLAAAVGTGAPAAAPEAPAVPLAKHVTVIIDASKQEVEVAAKAYYAAKEPGRPIRYPSKIAPALSDLMLSVDGVMSGLRQMLADHMDSAVKRLRVQVVQSYRLLERVPAAAMSLLVQHLLQAAGSQHQQQLSVFSVQRKQLEQQLELHKHSLHPSMLSVARQSELEALKVSEAARQQAAAALTSSCASACLSLAHSHAQQLGTAEMDLSRLLLALFDGCVLPADLMPAAEGDDALSSMQRLSLEELSKLAAAQDAAQPAGVLAATVQASKAAGQTSKAAKPGGDAAQSAAAPAAATPAAAAPTASGRPFCQVSWQLEASSAVGVAQLGWTPADQDALVTSNSATAGPAAPGAAAATTPAAAAPGAAKSAASNPAAKPVAAAAASTPPAQTASNAALQGSPTAAEAVLVSGLDTVCHRAVVLAHRDAVQRMQAYLSESSVAALKRELYAWATQEQQWARAWEAMLQDLDTVIHCVGCYE